MPTYEYICRKCAKSQDVFHKISEQPQLSCSACNTPLEKRPGAGLGLHFQGSGFYCTDYCGTQPKEEKRGCNPCGSCPCHSVATP